MNARRRVIKTGDHWTAVVSSDVGTKTIGTIARFDAKPSDREMETMAADLECEQNKFAIPANLD